MTNLFAKFNNINLQLQGEELNLIITKSIISAFQKKTNFMESDFWSQRV